MAKRIPMTRYQMFKKGGGWWGIIDTQNDDITVETIQGEDAARSRCGALNLKAKNTPKVDTIADVQERYEVAHTLVKEAREPHFGHLDTLDHMKIRIEVEIQRHQATLAMMLQELDAVIEEDVRDPDWRRKMTDQAVLLAAGERRKLGLRASC